MSTMLARQTLVRMFKRPAAARFLQSFECREFSSYSGGNRRKPEKTALVIGCSGAMGSEIVSHMHKNGIVDKIIGADLVPPQSEEMMNDNFDQKHMLSHFIQLDSSFHGDDADDIDMDPSTLSGLTYLLETGMEVYEGAAAEAANDHEEYESEQDSDNEDTDAPAVPLDVVVCTAGGWIPTADYGSPDYLLGVEQMLGQNLYPVIAASHIAATRLKPGGLFVVFGASVALAPTPGMLAYGISKSAIHHIVQTLGSRKNELVHSATAKVSPTIVGILPGTLDTPNNRKFAPDDTDFSQWTKMESIAEEIGHWISTPDLRPHSGSLVKVFPDKKGQNDVFRLVR